MSLVAVCLRHAGARVLVRSFVRKAMPAAGGQSRQGGPREVDEITYDHVATGRRKHSPRPSRNRTRGSVHWQSGRPRAFLTYGDSLGVIPWKTYGKPCCEAFSHSTSSTRAGRGDSLIENAGGIFFAAKSSRRNCSEKLENAVSWPRVRDQAPDGLRFAIKRALPRAQLCGLPTFRFLRAP